eukprot:126762_1
MINKLMSHQEIEERFKIKIAKNKLPTSSRSVPKFQSQLNQQNIKRILSNSAKREELINDTPWHNVHVFNKKHTKRRMTLSMTKERFIKNIKKYIYDNHNDDNIDGLVPIVVFDTDR